MCAFSKCHEEVPHFWPNLAQRLAFPPLCFLMGDVFDFESSKCGYVLWPVHSIGSVRVFQLPGVASWTRRLARSFGRLRESSTNFRTKPLHAGLRNRSPLCNHLKHVAFSSETTIFKAMFKCAAFLLVAIYPITPCGSGLGVVAILGGSICHGASVTQHRLFCFPGTT